MSDLSQTSADHDLAALQARVLRRRQRHIGSASPPTPIRALMAAYVREARARQSLLPARFALHLLVVLLVPLAVIINPASLAPHPPAVLTPSALNTSPADLVAPLAPLSLQDDSIEEIPVPESAFADIDALPVPALTPDMLAPIVIEATIAAESANVRGGPGTNYDKIGTLTAGTSLHVLTRFEGWYQVQTSNGSTVWITAELLNLDATAADFVPKATNIPMPPPPKVGLVAEEGLNLRDGPGTAYVGMTKLQSGTQLDLLARYNDWFHVQTADGQGGWVLGEFLTVAPGVVERVEVVTSIPDPNPSLVGTTSERNINLRGGPDVAFDKLGTLAAGVQLELLGRYKDWLKVRTPRGTTGWVSNELVDMSAYVSRRVPLAREIPDLPQAPPATRPQTPAQAPAAAPSRPAPAPAAMAGGAVQFAVQFVGSRYVWGGASPKGFDCSGFTMYVYGQYGLKLPHSSAGQYSTSYGVAISNPADLLPGDLVFFVNTYKRGISHVGIYIGDGNVVQALSPKQGVGVANLNGGYWAQHYYGAIRPSL